MSYLDGPEADILYYLPALMARLNDTETLVDVGCRTARILDFMECDYYGFDTSPEPISYAQQKYPSKIIELRSWNDSLKNPFDRVDTVVLNSVMIYHNNPLDFFNRLVDFYKPKQVIIQEISNQNSEDFDYVDLSEIQNKYQHTRYDIKVNIPCKYRTLLNVKL